MCAAVAGLRGRRVALLDRNSLPGRKILISGGGRCNFTNLHTRPDNFLSANPHFAKSALARYTPADFIRLVERHGIAYHEKTLGQLFCDGSAQQIVDLLMRECADAGVRVLLSVAVSEVRRNDSSGSFSVVTGKDGVPRNAVIRVNLPYDEDGVKIYQATYGFAITFVLTKDGRVTAGPPTTPIKEGEAFDIPGTTRAIQYSSFVGTIDPATGQAGPDPRPNNPGVVIEAYDSDTALGSVLIPLGKPFDLGAGYALTPKKYTLYSGFQYRYDPGIPLVLIGSIVLVLGLCISFYFTPARLYVVVTGAERHWNIGIAATTVKGYDIFEDRFREIVEALRRTPQAS